MIDVTSTRAPEGREGSGVTTYASRTMPSPVGALTLVASAQGLAGVLWHGEDGGRVGLGSCVEAPVDAPVLDEAERQLTLYFAGELRRFALPLAWQGTAFQTRVWRALVEIPFGETRSYGEVAAGLGRPTASRAVGAANGRNPISIIVPCHRLVGASGGLTGFAGGLAAKRFLLDHEARLVGGTPPPIHGETD